MSDRYASETCQEGCFTHDLDKFVPSMTPFVEDGAPCRNTWRHNQFSIELGPNLCIGTTVELDDDDVCALGDDDDDD